MFKNKLLLITTSFVLFYSEIAYSHSFEGMNGFYDGLSHPVLGLDHFLAMISVGIISAQIGGRAIWTVPSTFVFIMLIGGLIGVYFSGINHVIIEYGIILSVIFLGLGITIEKKIPLKIIMVFVGIFGFFHGTAHGLEMPNAANPFYFALGFITGTATLHIFGVIIGYFSIKTKLTSLILKLTGMVFAIYGVYLILTL